MLFDAGNPYRTELPYVLRLDWDDFTCGVSAANDAAVGRTAEWMVFAYMAADNNLASLMFDNLMAMKSIGSTDALHVCALFDGPLLTDSFFARLGAGTRLGDDICFRFRELRTNESATLAMAIQLASVFPAKRRLIILSGHGNGWRGALLDQNLGFQYKREPGRLMLPGPPEACDAQLMAAQKATQDRINTRRGGQPGASAGPAPRFDVLAFDACYMGNIEGVALFSDQADTLIVSEDQQPGEGYPYERLLTQVRDNLTQTPTDLAAYLVNETKQYYGDPSRRRQVTQAALDSAQLAPLVETFVSLVRMLDVDDDAALPIIQMAIEQAWPFAATASVDLYGFVSKLAQHPSEAVRDACQAFLSRWASLVTAAAVRGGEDSPNGLAIYAPLPAQFENEYIELSAQLPFGLPEWCAFLRRYSARRVR